MLPIVERKSIDYHAENQECAEHFGRRLTSLKVAEGLFLDQAPFPHVVIDDALPLEYADKIEAYGRTLAKLDDNIHLNSRKYANHRFWEFDGEIRTILSWFYSAQFESIISEYTQIDQLHSDPEFNLGGGYHVMPDGGFLNIHKDFNFHQQVPEYFRRLNFILYLNRGWREERGGELHLVDREDASQTKKVLPVFNRAVIFETNSSAWHGNPTPVNSPDLDRLSFATFYYTRDNSHCGQDELHSTLYTDGERQFTNRIREAALPLKKLLPNSLWQLGRRLLQK